MASDINRLRDDMLTRMEAKTGTMDADTKEQIRTRLFLAIAEAVVTEDGLDTRLQVFTTTTPGLVPAPTTVQGFVLKDNAIWVCQVGWLGPW